MVNFNLTTLSANSSLQDNFSMESTVLTALEAIFSFVGIMGNGLTMWIFASMGLKNGASLSFFFLSVSDFLYLVAVFVAAISSIFVSIERLSNFYVSFPVDPYSVHAYFANCGGIVYYNTMLNVAFISVVRCLSVAKPLWFRDRLGTKKTYVVFITVIAMFTVLNTIPLMALMGIIPQRDERTNSIRPTLWISIYYKNVLAIIWPIRGFFLPIAIELIVIISAISMKNFLKDAVAFRQRNTLTRSSQGSLALHQPDNNTGTKLKGKELQVTQQMFVLSLVFIISGVPKVGYCLAYIIFPEFSLNGNYGRLYEAVDTAAHMFQVLFCCSNILVYFKYSSKFRDFVCK